MIPGGCTSGLQAPDVAWNGPFKAKMRELYDSWLESEKITYTVKGNPRAPSKSDLADMVVSAWNSLSSEMIAKSFTNCGQSKSALPEDVSCMKPGKRLENALQSVKDVWSNPLSFSTEINENDFADHDDIELLANEIVVFEDNETETENTNDLFEDNVNITENLNDSTSTEVELAVITCSVCDDYSVALYFCKECDDKLCDECYLAHKKVKITRTHKLISLSHTSS